MGWIILQQGQLGTTVGVPVGAGACGGAAVVFDVVHAVLLNHAVEGAGHVVDDLRMAEVQKVSGGIADFLAESTSS